MIGFSTIALIHGRVVPWTGLLTVAGNQNEPRCKMIRISARVAAVFLGTGLVVGGFFFQSARAQAPSGAAVALTGARLIDGTGRTPLEQAALLVTNGRVAAVGAPGAIRIPDGAVRVDLSGKTIVPGLINAHAHVNADRESTLPVRDQLVAQLRLYAQYGVTTIHSLGDDGQESVKLRDEQEHGTLDRARLYVAGPNVTAKTPDEGRQNVDRVAAMKVNIIKTRVDGPDNSPTRMAPDVYRAIIDQAHQRGLRVAAHMYYLKDGHGLLDAGVDVLAHSIRDGDVDQRLMADLKRRNVGYIPTLTRDLSVFVYETTPAFFTDPFFLRGVAAYRKQMTQVSDPAYQEKTRKSEEAQTIKKALQQANRNLKLLADAGVPIAMGTDTGAQLGRWQGYFEHTELELMVKAGLTPMQTLIAATGDAARVMKLDGELGTLQPGKWADFVVLHANPLADIRNMRQIDAVWIAGRRLSDAP